MARLADAVEALTFQVARLCNALEGRAVRAAEPAALQTELVTVDEAARLCRVSKSSFNRHVRAKLSPVKRGARVFFSALEIQALNEGGELTTPAEPTPKRREPTSYLRRSALEALNETGAREIAERLKSKRKGG